MNDRKQQGEPSEKLERKAAENPENQDVQVDLGSDESMDASDPISATQPGGGRDDPVPRKTSD